MRFRTQLTALLAVLLATTHLVSSVESTSTAAPEASTAAPIASTVDSSATTKKPDDVSATTEGPLVSTTGGTTGTPGPTTIGPSTTTEPIVFATFGMTNDFIAKDAQLILQHAVQLKNQISDLNAALQQAQKDTDPGNSPLFDQLHQVNQTLSEKSATLQGYITQLDKLNNTQINIDSRINSATNAFVCFAGSSCVTDVPTTPEPTTQGPTPSETPCVTHNLNAKDNTTFRISKETHVDCNATITPSAPSNNVSLIVSLTLEGNKNGYVNIVETRTNRVVSFNTTVADQAVFVTGPAEIQYFADSRTTISFVISYSEFSSCSLNCGEHGVCVVSQSGTSYCQCTDCGWSGDNCENYASPCKAKQNRDCGVTGGFGSCYVTDCYDQCYACNCAPGTETTSPQLCKKPEDWTPSTVGPDPKCIKTTTAPFITSTTILLSTTKVAEQTTESGSTGTSTLATGPSAVPSTGEPSTTAAPSTGEPPSTTAAPSTGEPISTSAAPSTISK